MPELWPSEEDRRYVDDLLDSYGVGEGQELVGVNIAASARWETKNWPVCHIARLCARLAARGVRVVVTGLKKDLEDVMSLLMMTPCSQIINACGKTSVNQLACLIRRCSVYLSPDAAPLHIAAGQNVPVVAPFGPTEGRAARRRPRNTSSSGKASLQSLQQAQMRLRKRYGRYITLGSR